MKDHTKIRIRNRHSFLEKNVSDEISKAFFLVIIKAEMKSKMIKTMTYSVFTIPGASRETASFITYISAISSLPATRYKNPGQVKVKRRRSMAPA